MTVFLIKMDPSAKKIGNAATQLNSCTLTSC